MPNIRTYQSKADVPQPGQADSFVAGAGEAQAQGIKGFGDPLAKGMEDLGSQVVNYEEQNETSKLAADASTAQAELTKQWLDTARTADPNDTGVAQRFMDNVVNPRLDQVGADVSTRTGKLMWQKARAGLAADMFTKTAADQATLAGEAQVQNMTTVMNQGSDTVMSDPASFQSVMGMQDMALEGAVRTGLPRTKALELQTHMHKQTAQAMLMGIAANAGPDQAQAEMDSGKVDAYLDAGDKATLQTHFDTLRKAQTEQQKSDAAELRRQQQEQFKSAASEVTATTIGPDGQLTVPPDYYENVAKLRLLPGQDDGTVRAMLDLGRSLTRELAEGTPSHDDPVTFDNFQQRIGIPAGQPGALTTAEVLRARAASNLSDKSFTLFKDAALNSAKDPQAAQHNREFAQLATGFKGYIGQVGPFGNFLNPIGGQRYMEFSMAARQIFDQGTASGKSLPQIEADIIKIVPKYQVNNQDAANMMQGAILNGLKPQPQIVPATPRNPGESPADYLKRIKGQ